MRASFGHMERPDIHETRPTVEKVLQVSYLVVFKSFGYEYFVYIIFPPLILFFGLFGNIIGLAVLSRKKLIQIGPVHVYRFLLTIDSIYLVLIIQKYVQFGFNIPFNKISSLICLRS